MTNLKRSFFSPSLYLLLSASLCMKPTVSSCPNYCSGKGVCNSDTTCTCYVGFTGYDCSLRSCPSGVPWFGIAASTDTVHSGTTECSSIGTCDRSTGICACQTGFTGRACDRMGCNNDCNGHGSCITMSEAATSKDDVNLFYSTTYTLWDAEKIMGCICDTGFTGYDCSLRKCVMGHDPLTTGSPVDEVQAFDCTGASGSFKFTFRDHTTGLISYNAHLLRSSETLTSTAVGIGAGESLESKLESLPTIEDVTISVTGSSTGRICDSDGAKFKVTFTHEHGDLPTLTTMTSTVSSIAYDSGNSVTGTKTENECCNRGLCDRTSGICTCSTGFLSSDGTGTNIAGDNGDCGRTTGVSVCGGATSCSLAGTCSGSTAYQCTCNDGYTGSDCSLRTCPQGRAWFDEATAPNVAHANAECSNKGICDRTNGICTCMDGFTGGACERLKCPTTTANDCSGNGKCVSLEDAALQRVSNGIASATTYGSTLAAGTWDRRKIYGCICYDSSPLFMDNVYGTTGIDCALKTCPHGDNPKTAGVDEVQRIVCTADGGYFTITFRQQTTDKIYYNAPATMTKYLQLGTGSITFGSATLTSVSADLQAILSSGESIQLVGANSDVRNYTVSSVPSSSTVTLTEPVGMETASNIPIRHNRKSIKYALEELPNIRNVSVSLTTDGTTETTTACRAGGTYIDITFTGDYGDLPEITSTITSLTLTSSTSSHVISTTVTGTKEEVECSGNGICNRDKGVCSCFTQMTSSDGQGGPGRRADCGHREVH